MKKSGFSLIELMFVMSVISILVSISLPSITNKVKIDKIIELKKSGIRVIKAQELCYEKNGSYDTVNSTIADDTGKIYGEQYNTLFHFNEGWVFETDSIECEEGTTGFYFKLQDPTLVTTYRENYVEYNSCTDTNLDRPLK
jgi:prepilin-type N-terminal cleavage/methylation domain-containing protein